MTFDASDLLDGQFISRKDSEDLEFGPGAQALAKYGQAQTADPGQDAQTGGKPEGQTKPRPAMGGDPMFNQPDSVAPPNWTMGLLRGIFETPASTRMFELLNQGKNVLDSPDLRAAMKETATEAGMGAIGSMEVKGGKALGKVMAPASSAEAQAEKVAATASDMPPVISIKTPEGAPLAPPKIDPAIAARGETESIKAAIGAKSEQAATHLIESDILEQPTTGSKAVNINFDYIDSPEGVKKTLEQVAEQFKGEVNDARRGVQKTDLTKKLATDLGMTEDQLLSRGVGKAYNSEELLAARWMVNKSADDLLAMARDIRAGGNSDESLALFRQRVEKHAGLQAQLSGAVAEAGRALRQQQIVSTTEEALRARQVSDLLAGFGGRDQIMDIADGLAGLHEAMSGTGVTAGQISTYLKQARKATTGDMLLEAWINGLLSGPVTHSANTLSNAITSVWQIPERILAAPISQVLPGQKIALGEGLSMIHGMVEGMKDGFRLAGRGIMDVSRLRQPGSVDLLGKMEGKRTPAITAANVGLDPGSDIGRAVDLLGEAIRTPGKMLGVEDDFFKSVGYRMELRAQAHRQATREGLTGKAFTDRMNEIMADPPESIKLEAIDAARYVTFQGELGRIGKAAMSLSNSHPLMKVVIPFVRTPTNILKFTMERTPMAPFMGQVRADIAKGGPEAALALSRMALGTTIGAVAASYAADGKITGAGPSAPNARATLQTTGWQPYSLKIGDQWVSYQRLEPLGSILGIAADAAEIMGHTDDERERNRIASAVAGSFAKNLTSKTFLKGMSSAISAMEDPDRYGTRFIQGLAGSVVPAAVAQGNAAFGDDTRRDTLVKGEGWVGEVQEWMNAIRARTPGLSKDLPPVRDLWGEPVRREGALGPDILSPIYVSTDKKDPASDELTRLRLWLDKPKRVQNVLGADVELSPEQYDRFQELVGNGAKDPSTGLGWHDTVNALVDGVHPQSLAYSKASDGPEGTKAFIIKKYRHQFAEMSKKMLLAEYPEMMETIQEQRLAKVAARTGQ